MATTTFKGETGCSQAPCKGRPPAGATALMGRPPAGTDGCGQSIGAAASPAASRGSARARWRRQPASCRSKAAASATRAVARADSVQRRRLHRAVTAAAQMGARGVKGFF
ncbi:hypothetical protein GW17_00057504 [Ensete ventricosum]|nr:hypothetical protein GW17_00057504 [Ensete ventricosum]